MRLREWPPRRIAAMWGTTLALQVLAILIVPLLLGWEYAGAADDAGLDTSAPGSLTRAAPADTFGSSPGTGARPPITVTRTAVAPGDTIVRFQRGESFLEIPSSGGTVTMSPDVQKGAAAIGTALGDMLNRVALLLMVLGILLIVPLLVLMAVTLTWAVQRRRRPASPEPAPPG